MNDVMQVVMEKKKEHQKELVKCNQIIFEKNLRLLAQAKANNSNKYNLFIRYGKIKNKSNLVGSKNFIILNEVIEDLDRLYDEKIHSENTFETTVDRICNSITKDLGRSPMESIVGFTFVINEQQFRGECKLGILLKQIGLSFNFMFEDHLNCIDDHYLVKKTSNWFAELNDEEQRAMDCFSNEVELLKHNPSDDFVFINALVGISCEFRESVLYDDICNGKEHMMFVEFIESLRVEFDENDLENFS